MAAWAVPVVYSGTDGGGGASFLSFISNCYGGYHRNSLAPCEKRRPALFFSKTLSTCCAVSFSSIAGCFFSYLNG